MNYIELSTWHFTFMIALDFQSWCWREEKRSEEDDGDDKKTTTTKNSNVYECEHRN